MKVLKKAIDLFNSFNDNKIIYCHWKSNEHLLEGLAGLTDLDVLVEKKQSNLVTKILNSIGYIQLNSQYGSRYPNVEDWIACDDEFCTLIHIHLHYEMITGHAGLKEFNLPWTELALSTRIIDNDFHVYKTDPNLEIIILMTRIGLKATKRTRIKALFNKFALGKDDIKELKYLNNIIDKKVVTSIAEPYYGDQTRKLIEMMDCKEYGSKWIARLIKITNLQMKKWSRYKSIPLMLLKQYYSSTLFIRRVLHKMFKIRFISKKSLPDGSDVSIAFIGQDGAGKSTVVKNIHDWLSWKCDIQEYYMGCGDGYNSVVKKLMTFCSNKARTKSLVQFLSIIHYCLVARRVKGNIKSAKRFSAKGSIILFDRYPQIQFYGINDGPKIREITQRHKLPSMIQAIIHKYAEYEEKCYALATKYNPSLVVKLILPPEESAKRKPAESIEDIRKKSYIISSLVFPESDILSIDATMDYEEEIKVIRSAVWEIIKKAKNV